MKRIEFSEPISVSGTNAKFSPLGKYLAFVYANKICVLKSDSLQTLTILTTIDQVKHFEWSPDSQLILAVMPGRNKLQAFDITDNKWTCSIDAGGLGIEWATFSPDSRHIIYANEFHLMLSVISLIDKSVRTIEWPKNPAENLKFTPCGSLMIIGERKNTKHQDAISVVRLCDWKLDAHFETATQDFKSIQLDLTGGAIALSDPLPESRVTVYSITGQKYATVDSGVHSICRFSPTSQFLAIENTFKIDILNTITWSKIAACSAEANPAEIVYEETTNGFSISRKLFDTYIADEEAPNFTQTKFSATNRYISTVQGQCVLIFSVEYMQTVVGIYFKEKVKAIEWSPIDNRLSIGTNNGNLYLWTPGGTMLVKVPHHGISTKKLMWNQTGESCIIYSKDKCSIAFFDGEEKENTGKDKATSEPLGKANLNIINRA